MDQEKAIELYKHCRDFESDFNGMQDRIRNIASAWMLSAFGGIGWAMTLEIGRLSLGVLSLDKPLLVQILCVLACLGLFVLWVMDQMVYQNLLRSAWMAGVEMEFAHDFLPKIRKGMWSASRNVGMGKWIKIYYVVPMGALTLAAALAIGGRLQVLPALACLAFPILIFSIEGTTKDYAALAETLGGKGFREEFARFAKGPKT